MHRLVLILLSLIMSVSIARASDLFSLATDKLTYQLSEKAHITITVLSPPANNDVEYTYEAEMNGVGSTVVSLGDTHAVAISGSLGATTPFSVKLYLQNIRKAAEYSTTIKFYQKQNLELDRKIAKETNTAAKAVLNQQKTRNIAIIGHAESLKVANRTLLQTRSIDLVVDSLSSTLKPKLLNPTVVITQTNSNSIYELGEQAQFNVTISNVTSDTEVLSKAQIPYHQGKPEITMVKGGTVSSVVTYNTPEFTLGDVGKRKFVANVSYRSKAQAAYYKDLVTKSEAEKAKIIKKRNATQDARLKEYYSAKIADIDSVVYGFKNKLDGLLVKITENAELPFRIKDQSLTPQMIIEWPTEITVVEGGTQREGSVRLNYEPDSDIVISFDTGDQLNPIASLTVNSENWQETHSFSVVANNDEYLEGYHPANLLISSAGPDFDGQAESQTFWITDRAYKYHGLSVGTNQACAIYGQRLACWGTTGDYEFGNGFNLTMLTPSVVTQLNRVTAVKNGYRHRCAISDGVLYCWGRNSSGQVGTGWTSSYIAEPFAVPGMEDGVTDFGLGTHHTCAIRYSGVYCWGAGDTYQNGSTTAANIPSPSYIYVPGTPVKLSMGSASTCVLNSANEIYCFGSNATGEMGTGTSASVSIPTLVTNFNPNGQVVKAMSSGVSNLRCVTTANTRCSGQNSFRQIGDYYLTATSYLSPVSISYPFTAITNGAWTHSCGIYNSNAYCYGSIGSTFNYIGNNSTTGNSSPTQVSGLNANSVTEIAASHYQTCATDSEGLKCWGEKYLGNGTDQSSLKAILVSQPYYLTGSKNTKGK